MALLNYTGKNVRGIGLKTGEIIRLLPGINEVEDLKFAECKAHPLFPSLTKQGLVAIIAEPATKDGKRTVEEMLEFIPKILDVKLLKKLIETDGRDRVVSSASAQLDRIKNPEKAKQEDSNNEHFS